MAPPPLAAAASSSQLPSDSDCDDLDLDLCPAPLEAEPPHSLQFIFNPAEAREAEYSLNRLANEDAQYHIRKRWISDRLRERASSFVRLRDVTVFCGTYNVNGRKDEEDLTSWLQPGRSPGIYAVGFQEIVELNAVNVAVDSKSLQRAAHWRSRVDACLSGYSASYELKAQQHLVGILLLVYVRSDLAAEARDVQVETPTVGVMGVLGNKGAVCVRLQLHLTTFCFVCSHLAASRANVAGRNSDYRNILLKSSFSGDPETAWEFRGLSSEYSSGRVAGGLGVLDHDIVFWLGDLNYRIAEHVRIEDVFARSTNEQGLAFLRERDQLTLERRRGACFGGFEEGPLLFQPTYKYQPGTAVYEQRPDKKRRAPAWCDRVLWRCTDDATALRLESYGRAELLLSDHKPVFAIAEVRVREVAADARLRAYADIDRGIRCWDGGGGGGGGLPAISLGSSCVDLGDVGYLSEAVGRLRVANVGRSLAYLRLVPKAGDRLPWRRWLEVSPAFALLTPGDRAEFIVTAKVDRALAVGLAAGTDILHDTLVVRLENGPEYHIAVTGRYVGAACFGALLQGPGSSGLAIPPELWRLIDALAASGALANADMLRGLFAENSSAAEGEAVRACLGSGAPFPLGVSPLALAETVLLLLASLPAPLVPADAVAAVEAELGGRAGAANPTSGVGWAARFLAALPPANYNVFLYVACFLREVAAACRGMGLSHRGAVTAVAEAMCDRGAVEAGGAAGAAGAAGGGAGDIEASARHLQTFTGILMHFIM